MIKTQTWKSDTCECVIEQQFEEGLYEITLVNKVVSKCTVHLGITDVDIPTVAIENNKRKNRVFKFLFDNLRTKLFEQVQQGEDLTWQLKSGIEYNWNFTGTDKDRVLSIVIVGINLTTAEKNLIRTWADTEFGVGKVTI